jgi:hypothetical protein
LFRDCSLSKGIALICYSNAAFADANSDKTFAILQEMASSGKPANLLYKNKSRGQLYVKQCVVDQPNTQDRVITETPGKGRRGARVRVSSM